MSQAPNRIHDFVCHRAQHQTLHAHVLVTTKVQRLTDTHTHRSHPRPSLPNRHNLLSANHAHRNHRGTCSQRQTRHPDLAAIQTAIRRTSTLRENREHATLIQHGLTGAQRVSGTATTRTIHRHLAQRLHRLRHQLALQTRAPEILDLRHRRDMTLRSESQKIVISDRQVVASQNHWPLSGDVLAAVNPGSPNGLNCRGSRPLQGFVKHRDASPVT